MFNRVLSNSNEYLYSISFLFIFSDNYLFKIQDENRRSRSDIKHMLSSLK